MTSSLVGSEMCIRDSALKVPWCCIAWLHGGEAAIGGRRPSRCLRGGGAPVSYTHLTLPTICSV
eukprot:1348302-Prorocentrum_lima.AAC.1